MTARNSPSALYESDVLLVGKRAATWLADEVEWMAFVRSTYCEPCKGRGYHVVRHFGYATEFPTCWVCGGEGRPRRAA